jgi:hypothetical protein
VYYVKENVTHHIHSAVALVTVWRAMPYVAVSFLLIGVDKDEFCGFIVVLEQNEYQES